MNNQSSSKFVTRESDSTGASDKQNSSRRKWLWILGGVATALIVLQLFGPTLENPSVDRTLTAEAKLHVPTDVRYILRTACMDCHSHTTDWPWFTHVAPVSWLASHNVHEGREHLNFSSWGNYTPEQQEKLLDEISTVVRHDRMPPSLYKLTHPDARLSTNERFALYFWARSQIERLRAQ